MILTIWVHMIRNCFLTYSEILSDTYELLKKVFEAEEIAQYYENSSMDNLNTNRRPDLYKGSNWPRASKYIEDTKKPYF